jgi:hypothetical protein
MLDTICPPAGCSDVSSLASALGDDGWLAADIISACEATVELANALSDALRRRDASSIALSLQALAINADALAFIQVNLRHAPASGGRG